MWLRCFHLRQIAINHPHGLTRQIPPANYCSSRFRLFSRHPSRPTSGATAWPAAQQSCVLNGPCRRGFYSGHQGERRSPRRGFVCLIVFFTNASCVYTIDRIRTNLPRQAGRRAGIHSCLPAPMHTAADQGGTFRCVSFVLNLLTLERFAGAGYLAGLICPMSDEASVFFSFTLFKLSLVKSEGGVFRIRPPDSGFDGLHSPLP